MLARYWSLIGLCLALASGPVFGQEQAKPNPPTSTKSGGTESSLPPFPIVIVQTGDDAANQQKREQQADAHDAADLIAQQQAASAAIRSATATEGQLQPIWASVILSAIAAIISVGALILGFVTQRSINKTSRAELRAYVNVSEMDIEIVDRAPEVTVRFQNTGQTPARNVRIHIGITPIEPTDDLMIEEDEPHSTRDLGAGQVTEMTVVWQGFADDLKARRLTGDEKSWFHGVVSYRDVFDDQQFTWFKSKLTTEESVSGSGQFAVTVMATQDGNHST